MNSNDVDLFFASSSSRPPSLPFSHSRRIHIDGKMQYPAKANVKNEEKYLRDVCIPT